MSSPSGVATLTINTRISHTVRTLTVRDDLVGWVISGRKRLSTPHGDKQFCANEVFLIPRSTQWDVINEADPGGSYQARIISFSPQLLEQFFALFLKFVDEDIAILNESVMFKPARYFLPYAGKGFGKLGLEFFSLTCGQFN